METQDSLYENSVCSLPSSLCLRRSRHPGGGYEVWSLEHIPIGVKFGPKQHVFIDGMESTDNEEIQQKVALKEDAVCLDRMKEIEFTWLQYVKYTHNIEEGNLMAVSSRLGLYYVTCKSISAETKLLVWFQDANTEDGSSCPVSREVGLVGKCNTEITLLTQDNCSLSVMESAEEFPSTSCQQHIIYSDSDSDENWSYTSDSESSSSFFSDPEDSDYEIMKSQSRPHFYPVMKLLDKSHQYYTTNMVALCHSKNMALVKLVMQDT